MDSQVTIVMVLRSGKDFSFRDVELLARHINGKWQSKVRPRLICLWDKASKEYDLGNIHFIPLVNDWPGTWSRMTLYSPEMEKYRPFLYIDLDTAVIKSLENIVKLIADPTQFIVLEDFYQPGKIATGLAWIPANSAKIKKIWIDWNKGVAMGARMDTFLRRSVTPDGFWQQATQTIKDFKPSGGKLLTILPADTNIVCFHGQPRIFTCVEGSMTIDWVKSYVEATFNKNKTSYKVTVIIPYKVDRGWLKEAINSVPDDVQLIVSQGNGNWPENFNKVLGQAEGKYIKWLHEDDMLTSNCIEDSVKAIEEQDVDFIHGQALEIYAEPGRTPVHYIPAIEHPTVADLLKQNVFHCATLMYKREVFEKVGRLDETLNTAEEFEFNLRCLKAGLKVGYCPEILAFYRRHRLQKVRRVPKLERDKEREMVKAIYND